jgi:hypothetical protein
LSLPLPTIVVPRISLEGAADNDPESECDSDSDLEPLNPVVIDSGMPFFFSFLF